MFKRLLIVVVLGTLCGAPARASMLLDGVGGGSFYSPQAVAFFARLATQPTMAQATIYDRYISGLVTAGVWSKGDALYLLAAADQPTAKTNLISSSYTATNVGSPAFAAFAGYTGLSSGLNYINTNFNPTVGSPNYTINAASMFVWRNYVGGASGNCAYAYYDGTDYASIQSDSSVDATEFLTRSNSSGFTFLNYNQIYSGGGYLGSSTLGMVGWSRNTSSTAEIYSFGVASFADSTATGAIPGSSTFDILCPASSSYMLDQISIAWFGGLVSDADAMNLSVLSEQYMTDINGVTPAIRYGLTFNIIPLSANLEPGSPAIARLSTGQFIVKYENGSSVYGNQYYTLSTDTVGLNWGAQQLMIAPPTGYEYRDGGLVVLQNGNIVASTAQVPNPTAGNYTVIIIGTVSAGPTISWGSPIQITSTIFDGAMAGQSSTASGPIILADGRLMQGFHNTGGLGATKWGVDAQFSSDGGNTWGNEVRLFIGETYPTDVFTEVGIAQLPSGACTAVVRNDNPITTSRSGYWQATATDCINFGTPTQIYVTIHPGKPSLVASPDGALLFFGRYTGDNTGFGTMWMSYPPAGPWSSATQYHVGPGLQYSYSGGFYDTTTNQGIWAITQGSGSYEPAIENARMDMQALHLQ